ncbi:efflux RND transporter permease subunit [Limnoglobus roseus]|uniref:AcrB/AcrD/AcrF family protein n=1 Tax=Limnoglobus roseus TaxID=2598579 RepID=A0A5C1AVC4_9BACT|nr:efflux RND transporter permease subunit [Limnoglobus roseus]QEL20758.1 AcrB/AcrD/AcrF family protein [Limnoglobus roseus]
MRPAISAVLVLACALPALAADPPAGVIRVTAVYPGADARTLDDTVIAPLFKQLVGVEGMTRIESEAQEDGTGTVTVYFEPKADLNFAQMAVQNRASLARPVIPAPCRKLGLSVRKLPASPTVFWVALTSADDKPDAAFLANYATIYLQNELCRVPGVVDVRVVGSGELGIRVLVKPDRLRAYNVSVGDVVEQLRRQNVEVAAGGAIGGRAVAASGRLTKPEEFADVILKATRDGEILRVKDVATVELGHATGESAGSGLAYVNGKPATLIAVTAWPAQVTADKLLKVDAADELPPGVRFDVVADPAADRRLEVEVRVPPGSSPEYTRTKATEATELIRGLPGKPHTVAFAKGRRSDAVTILIKLPAKGGPTVKDVNKALDALPNAAIRVGAVPPGGEAFPVRLALTGPLEGDDEALREVTDRFVARLLKEPGVAEPGVYPGPPEPHFAVNTDRDKCAQASVGLDDVFTTLQMSLGGVHATHTSVFGRMLPVTVRAAPESARFVEDLEMLFVRNATGEMVPLTKFTTLKKTLAPPAIVRVNGRRAVIVTAAPAAGQTPAEIAALCLKLAPEVLPKGYRVKDLTEPSR